MTAARALTPEQHRVATWYDGVRSLRTDRPAASGLIWREPGMHGRPGVWAAVHAAMLAFLDDWGERAADLGWTTEQLFGVHRLAGAIRADCTGALVSLYPFRALDVTATTILLGRKATRLTFRGLSNPAESIPLWDFPGAACRDAAST